MKPKLNSQFNISGFTKPGANAEEIDNFTANDFIILCCGSNDTDNVKLNTVLNNFTDFIKRVTWTNIILLTKTLHHDLSDSHTSLNNEITIFNKKLLKLGKVFSHLSVIEINTNKHLYTNHGLHLNNLGKEILSLSLALKILSLVEQKENHSANVIELSYYELITQTTDSLENQPILPVPTTNAEITLPKCIRKKPVTKTDDFLWGI
jgi:hypothetical protein